MFAMKENLLQWQISNQFYVFLSSKSLVPGIFPYMGALGAKKLKTMLSSGNALYLNVVFNPFTKLNFVWQWCFIAP